MTKHIMSFRRLVVATATLLAMCRGVQLRAQSNSTEQETVCISIAAYEEPAWVNLLIANAFKFSEPGTKIVLHLNKGTTYDEADIKRWQAQSPRVAVSEERVFVKAFTGAVLWSHLVNAETMAKTWGDECKYFVLQASNMMWVRPGWEEQVRARRFTPLCPHPPGGGCQNLGKPAWVGFSKKIAPQNVYGNGQAEGSFFPLQHILDFKHMLSAYIANDLQGDWEHIAYAQCFFEQTWLQTYMLNFAKLPEKQEYNARGMHALCYNSIHIHNELRKQEDSIELESLQAVLAQSEGFENFYAVKRVNRDMTHPTTKLIISMSQ